MLESGIELLKEVLFARSESGVAIIMYQNNREARSKAAAALGRIGTQLCIDILRHYIEAGDADHEVLPEAVDAYGWALERLNDQQTSNASGISSRIQEFRNSNPFVSQQIRGYE